MSEEVKVDEKFLKSQAVKAESLCELILYRAKQMTDENEDLFNRYMAFQILSLIFDSVDMAIELGKRALTSGHNLKHVLLQTEIAKKNHWDEIKLENDLFFTTDKENRLDEIVSRFGKGFMEKGFMDTLNEILKERYKKSEDEDKTTH